MEMINLGQYGQPRPSMLAPMREGLATGIELGMKAKSLKTQVAQQEFAQQDKNRAFAMNTLDQLSLMKDTKSPEEWQMFETSEHYKQISNSIIKPYLPEFYDKETKKILVPEGKDVWAKRIESNKARIVDKVMKGETLTDSERAVADMLNMAGTDDVATVMSLMMRSDLEFPLQMSSSDPAQVKLAEQKLMNALKSYRTMGGRAGVGYRQRNDYTAPLAPPGAQSPRTPLSADEWLKQRGFSR